MKKLIFVLGVFLPMMSLATIGTDQGNGGDAVLMDGKYYLLDLVEAGVELQPYIDMNIQARADFRQRVEKALPAGFPHELIAKKLTEVYDVNVMFSHVLLKSIEAYQWKIVNSALLNIHDENTNLDIPRKNLFQLAVRKDSSILVDRNLWQKLDNGNRVALVFHEILYALDQPVGTGRFLAPGYPIQYQRSQVARELNGYLFSDLPRQGDRGLQRFTDYYMILTESLFADFPGVSDQGNSLVMNVFIQMDINNEWISRRDGGTSININTYPNEESEELLTAACRFGLQAKKPVKALFHEGAGLYISLSGFQSDGGLRKYINISRKDGMKYNLVNQAFGDEKSCLKALKNAIGPKVQEIRRDYK